MPKLTEDTMPWDHYDSLGVEDSQKFLEEHPEAQQLLYSREMIRMNKRRIGEAPVESGHTGPTA